MDKLKDFFNKKKSQAKFKVAGPGYKLSEGKPSQPQQQRHVTSQSQVPRAQPTSSASSAAAEAAMKRSQQPKKETNRALALIMEDEKRKVLAEMKAKEEKEQKEEIARSESRKKYVCPSLGITEGYPVDDLKAMIEEGIRTSYEDDKLLMSALLIKNCNEEQKTHLCINTLELVLGNLRTEDETQLEKFKRLKKMKIQQKILDINGGVEFLSAVGFAIDESNEWFVLNCDNKEIKDKVEYCLDVLHNVEKLKLEIDRELVVKHACDFPSLIEFDNEFYEVTVEDVRKEQERLTQVRKQEDTLMTKAMRQRLQNDVPELSRLRIKVDETKLVEANFFVRETVGDLASWLTRNFLSDTNQFDIIFNQKVIPANMYSKTLMELNLYPKVCLFIKAK